MATDPAATPSVAPPTPAYDAKKDPNSPMFVTAGDISGAASRLNSEHGGTYDAAKGASAYQAARDSGMAHEDAYQASAKASAPQGSAQGGPGGGGAAPQTAVTATGGMPPPAPPPVPAAAPAAVGARADARTPEQVAPQVTYDPYKYTDPSKPQTAYQPDQLSAQFKDPTTLSTYNPATFQNTLAAAPQQPGAYGGSTMSQFQGPNQQANDSQQSALMSSILANPETLGPNQVAQMKEAQKQQALLMGQQSDAQYAQGAVGRGTLNSGAAQGYRAQSAQGTNDSILNSNRAVDLSAAATNRQDQLNALGASSNLAQDQLGRATSAFGATLTGQQAQSADTQAAALSAANRWATGDTSNQQHAAFGLGVDQANAGQQLLANQSLQTSQAAANANNQAQSAFNLSKGVSQAGLNQAGVTSANAASDSAFNRSMAVQTANANEGHLGYTSQAGANTDAYTRALGYAGAASGNYGQDVAAQLGQQQIGLSQQGINNAQTNANNTLDFNYAQLGQNGKLALGQQAIDSGLKY